MAELNKVRLFLVLSFMISSSQAVKLFLANAPGTFNSYTNRRIGAFKLQPDTIKAVVYVCEFSSFQNIMNDRNANGRRQIENELRQKKYEWLYLGVKRAAGLDLKTLVGNFIREMIKTDSQNLRSIEILAESAYFMEYEAPSHTYKIYNEDPEGILLGHLNAMAANSGEESSSDE